MIINYAWANPITGIREQTPSTSEWKRWQARKLLRGARFRAWSELQNSNVESVAIHEQVKIGVVTSGNSEIDIAIAGQFAHAGIEPQFAWTDPATGARHVSDVWPSHLEQMLSGPGAYVSEVWVYGVLASWMIRKDAPRPADPSDTLWSRLRKFFRPEPDLSRFQFGVPDGPLCTCQGDGILGEGQFCVCETGRELWRAYAVRDRGEVKPQ